MSKLNVITFNDLKKHYQKKYIDQYIPFVILRIADNSEMILNNDFQTYSFKDHYDRRYTLTRIMLENKNNCQHFKIMSYAPLENIFNYPRKYFKKNQIKINYRKSLKNLIKYKHENLNTCITRRII